MASVLACRAARRTARGTAHHTNGTPRHTSGRASRASRSPFSRNHSAVRRSSPGPSVSGSHASFWAMRSGGLALCFFWLKQPPGGWESTAQVRNAAHPHQGVCGVNKPLSEIPAADLWRSASADWNAMCPCNLCWLRYHNYTFQRHTFIPHV